MVKLQTGHGSPVTLYDTTDTEVGSAANPITVSATMAASATGGATNHSAIMLNSTNATAVGAAGAHTIYDIQCFSNMATIAYLKIYDTATAPTPGAGTPVWRGMIPSNSGGAGFTAAFPSGKAFTLGIGYVMTTGIADADTGAVAATSYLVNISYK